MAAAPLEVGTVHHVSFRVDDLDESLRFYEGILGLAQIPRPDLSMKGVWLSAGATQVHLIEASASEDLGYAPRTLIGLANHVAFRVASLDDTERGLRAHGCSVLRGTEVPQLMVQDPSGNVIEFTQGDVPALFGGR